VILLYLCRAYSLKQYLLIEFTNNILECVLTICTQGFFSLSRSAGRRADDTDDTARSAVLSPAYFRVKMAFYFGQDAEATAHTTIVITSSVFTAGHFILMAEWPW
jgi:hypothetical protein